jgi:hypothetical protein
MRRRSGEGALGQVLAEPLGRDWVDPLRDLSLRRRLDAGLLSEGMLHGVEQIAEQDQLYQDHPETRVRNALAGSTPAPFPKT